MIGGFDFYRGSFNRASAGLAAAGLQHQALHLFRRARTRPDARHPDIGHALFADRGTDGIQGLGAQERRQRLRAHDHAAAGAVQVQEHGVHPHPAGHYAGVRTGIPTRFRFEKSRWPAVLPIALGAGSATPLQVANAYSVWANGGYRVTLPDRQGHRQQRQGPDAVAAAACRR